MPLCLRGEKPSPKVECPSSSLESEGHIVSTGPVSRILSRTIIPLGPPSLADSSDLPGSSAHRAGTHASLRLQLLPYLVLLRVGFAMRRALLPGRCALTAPFHPYRSVAAAAVFSLWHFPSTGLEPGRPGVTWHIALWSSDFPLPSGLSPGKSGVNHEGSDRPVQQSISIIR